MKLVQIGIIHVVATGRTLTVGRLFWSLIVFGKEENLPVVYSTGRCRTPVGEWMGRAGF